ncbi:MULTISPECIES: DinB family protein [Paenibacillus]|uniref:DinB family protein n=1 Tax=Paenibacillus TaxID=44249 RepID=UPI0022B8A5B3|nr:DinB family protein [Paenibacillus caseinilyticus]MCZ8519592.1 DinB family protein [Paenibacillus caseinilyticus]
MAQAIINTGKVLHQIVIGKLQGVEEATLDVQPEGFNNTIRWNAGHIVCLLDKFSTLSFGSPSAVPDSYEALFNTGTKPADWSSAPPSKEELLELLTAQLARLSELTPDMLEEKLEAPVTLGPFQFNTAGELFNFALIHEAIHLGMISSQLKVQSC